jgi:hypothetical protein
VKPYLIAAFFCERILKEEDGVLSAIRIVDVFNVHVPKENPPDSIPAIQLTMMTIFKSEEPATYSLTFEILSPSGQKYRGGQSAMMSLEGKEKGANLILHFPVAANEYGLYWIDLFIDEERITRVPFKIQLAPNDVIPKVGAGTSISGSAKDAQ